MCLLYTLTLQYRTSDYPLGGGERASESTLDSLASGAPEFLSLPSIPRKASLTPRPLPPRHGIFIHASGHINWSCGCIAGRERFRLMDSHIAESAFLPGRLEDRTEKEFQATESQGDRFVYAGSLISLTPPLDTIFYHLRYVSVEICRIKLFNCKP